MVSKFFAEMVSSLFHIEMLTKTDIYFLRDSKINFECYQYRISVCMHVCVCVYAVQIFSKIFSNEFEVGQLFSVLKIWAFWEWQKAYVHASYIYDTGIFKRSKKVDNATYHKTNMQLFVFSFLFFLDAFLGSSPTFMLLVVMISMLFVPFEIRVSDWVNIGTR